MDRHVLTLDESTCRRRTSIKWRHHPQDVLPLWIAEMDVLPAPAVARELQRIGADGDVGYPVGRTYLEAVSRWYATWDAPADPARMALVTDAMTGVTASVTALTAPNDPVYVTTPVYPPFHSFVAASGRRVVGVPLTREGRYDIEALTVAFAEEPGRGAVLLSNPHNPTGAAPSPAELSAIAQSAATHGVGVISDEVHAPLVLPGAEFTSILSVPGGENALSVISPAKGWNLAGLKSAAVVGGPQAGPAVRRIPAELATTASHVAVRVHIAAMDEGRDWQAKLVADLDANRALLKGLIEHHLPSVRWRPGEATYFAWLDCRELGLGDDPGRHFLRQAKVALNSGIPFGNGAGHVRMNFATSTEILSRAVVRMAESLD